MVKRLGIAGIFVLVVAAAFAAHFVWAAVGYYYNFTVLDEDGQPMESGFSVTVNLANTSTAAALYTSDVFEGAGITIPITSDVTGVSTGGTVRFYGPQSSYDVIVANDAGHKVKYSGLKGTDHRVRFPFRRYNLPALTDAMVTQLEKAYSIYDDGDPGVLIATEESFTTSLKSAYDGAVTDKHTHDNSDLLDALVVKAGTSALETGSKAITFATAFADTVTPVIMITNLESAAALYAESITHEGFTARDGSTGTDDFSWMAIAPYDPNGE